MTLDSPSGVAENPSAATDGPLVVGLDISLTATGLAWSDGRTMTYGRDGLTNPRVHIQERGRLLMELALEIGTLAAHRTLGGPSMIPASNAKPVLAVAENIPTGGRTGADVQVERCYLWLAVINLLGRWGIPVLEVTPTQIKKYACGLGNANKREAVAGIKQWFPGWEVRKTGKRGNVLTTDDDNKADGVGAMAIGRDLLGAPVVELPARHRDVLKALELPPGVRLAT